MHFLICARDETWRETIGLAFAVTPLRSLPGLGTADQAAFSGFARAVGMLATLDEQFTRLSLAALTHAAAHHGSASKRGRLYCEICGCWARDKTAWAQHIDGARHRRNTSAEAHGGLSRLVFGDAIVRDEDIIASVAKERKEFQAKAGASQDGTILLYYMYVDIEDVDALRKWQFELCTSLGLYGRIKVAFEGLNGTVSGPPCAVECYKLAHQKHSHFGKKFNAIDFKESKGPVRAFPSLFVRKCNELCSMGVSPEKISWKNAGQHLSPEEFHSMLVDYSRDEVPLLDCRNLYESAIGRFDGAVPLPTRRFTEFPMAADDLVDSLNLQSKRAVLLYCTGGIRCERASAYLKSKGVNNCLQLRGGIFRYCEQLEDKALFRGRNYVFDRRGASCRQRSGECIGKCAACNAQMCDVYRDDVVCPNCCSSLLQCDRCYESKLPPTCPYCSEASTSYAPRLLYVSMLSDPDVKTSLAQIMEGCLSGTSEEELFSWRHDEEMLFPRNEEIDSQNKVHLVSLRIPEKFKNFHSSRRTPLANANFYRKKRDSGSTAAAAAAAAFAAHRPRNKKGIKGKQIELQLQKYR